MKRMLTAASWAENIFVGSRDDETLSGTGRLQGSLLTMFFRGHYYLKKTTSQQVLIVLQEG